MNNKKKLSAYAGIRELAKNGGINHAFNLSRMCAYDGIELLFLTNECDNIINEAKLYSSAISSCGIKVVCISCFADLVTKSEPYSVDTASVEAIKKCIDLAEKIGCPYVHHTIVTRLIGSRDDYDKVLPIAISSAGEIASYAKSRGIDIIYEPQGMLFNGNAGYSAFFDLMRAHHENVGICLDVGNTLWVDEDCYLLAEKYAEYIKHVHLKDYIIGSDNEGYKTLGGSSIKEVKIGNGVIDFFRVFKILEGTGYNGYISIEDNSNPDFETTAKESRNFLENLP